MGKQGQALEPYGEATGGEEAGTRGSKGDDQARTCAGGHGWRLTCCGGGAGGGALGSGPVTGWGLLRGAGPPLPPKMLSSGKA